MKVYAVMAWKYNTPSALRMFTKDAEVDVRLIDVYTSRSAAEKRAARLKARSKNTVAGVVTKTLKGSYHAYVTENDTRLILK